MNEILTIIHDTIIKTESPETLAVLEELLKDIEKITFN